MRPRSIAVRTLVALGVATAAAADGRGRRPGAGARGLRRPRDVVGGPLHARVYVPDAPVDVSTLPGPGTPKLVRMDVVDSGEAPGGLPEAWREGLLRQEVSRDLLRTLQGLYSGLEGGDVVTVSYAPDRGTILAASGEQVATKPGHDTMAALPRLFVGPDPVSGNMKRLLLQGSC